MGVEFIVSQVPKTGPGAPNGLNPRNKLLLRRVDLVVEVVGQIVDILLGAYHRRHIVPVR